MAWLLYFHFLQSKISAWSTPAMITRFNNEKVYTNLGIEWASSLLAFITVAITPFPLILFLRGNSLRIMSKLT